ncbi:MAG TPA: bifunctional serine/threonine-protein kinase/formylglycine-generating enzyme family protein [Kofleriaceae bacterium]|nr:bifunctional serine/threonine-protein kinase/formylglycine-generating enzyme family protein [Kofleriaceae bacterium]
MRARFCPSCGHPSVDATIASIAAPEAPEAGGTLSDPRQRMLPPRLIAPGTRILDRYQIDGVLGEGGMGVVYRATDLMRERSVGIKALHASLLGDAEVCRRFKREAQLMLGWNHRYVARVHDFIEHEDLLAFVMEYVDGPTLEEYAQRWNGQLPYDDIRQIFTGVLEAIGEAHAVGIVHRDLKPHNILLRLDEHGVVPKIVDFGVAKVLEGTTYTMSGAMLGTCRYMSPEQVKSPQHVDHRSDIYSLGVTLYRCVTGRTPFEGNSHFAVMMAHVQQLPEPPSAFRPHLPPALEQIMLQALAKDRADRPQSCAEFRTALDRSLADVTAGQIERESEPPRVVLEDDGNEMRLIPAGPFQLGAHRRVVMLDRFYLARYPVTNRQFQAFVEATGYRPSDPEAHRFLHHFRNGSCPPELVDHPVVFVSWTDARAYCRWAARRLPSEAEWEKAARGPDGNKYPWGREEPTPELANFGQARAKIYPITTGDGGTAPVTAFPHSASPYGIEGMAGNVFEWCEDVDDPGFYLHGPERNPRNTIQPGDVPCVIRGGSWRYDARSLRTYARTSFPVTFRLDTVGFRVAL